MELNKEILISKMVECGIPDYMHESLAAYILKHSRVGTFLTAVLSNQLVDSVKAADVKNMLALVGYAQFLYSYAPSNCWGSKAKVIMWLRNE